MSLVSAYAEGTVVQKVNRKDVCFTLVIATQRDRQTKCLTLEGKVPKMLR